MYKNCEIIPFVHNFEVDFTFSQATKALRESRGIALLYFKPRH